jgi:predicted transcriptional regulator
MHFTEKIDTALAFKGRGLFSVAPDASVFDAVKEMADRDVGALAVLGENRLLGVISERDYARKVIMLRMSPHDDHLPPASPCRVNRIISVQVEMIDQLHSYISGSYPG